MKHYLIVSSILITLLTGCEKEKQSEGFTKIFGSTPEFNFGSNTLIKTNDNNVVILYHWDKGDINRSQIHLKKINEDGKEIWDKAYSSEYGCYAYSVVQTNDNGYLIAGTKQISEMWTSTYSYLIKTNSDGDEIWEKNYGDGIRENGCVVKQMSNGNIVFLTKKDVSLNFLTMANEDGDTIWSRDLFVTTEYFGFYDFIITNDENILLVGETIVKMDTEGKVIWNKNLKGLIRNSQTPDIVKSPIIKSVCQSGDNSCLFFGKVDNGFDDSDYLLVKTSDDGEIIWQETYNYGGTGHDGRSVNVLSSGEIIMIGTTEEDFDERISVIKTDSSGKMIWNFDRNEYTQGLSILHFEDNTYFLLGIKYDSEYYNQMVVKKFIK